MRRGLGFWLCLLAGLVLVAPVATSLAQENPLFGKWEGVWQEVSRGSGSPATLVISAGEKEGTIKVEYSWEASLHFGGGSAKFKSLPLVNGKFGWKGKGRDYSFEYRSNGTIHGEGRGTAYNYVYADFKKAGK
jgi:hypothetical protein